MNSFEGRQERSTDENEASALVAKLTRFRDGLDPAEARAFDHLVAGARAAVELRGQESSPATSFADKFARFAAELEPSEQRTVAAISAASSFAWGVVGGKSAAGDDPTVSTGESGGNKAVYMLHALLPAAAIITVGIVLIVDELTDDDGGPGAADLSGIPTSPEEI